MNQRGTNRWVLAFGAGVATMVFASCGIEPESPPDAQPPPAGTPVGQVPIAPPPDDGTPPPEQPPPLAPPPDVTACPLSDGNVVNCTEQLSAANYCTNVYGDGTTPPNFTLVAGCGACDAAFFQTPAGVTCELGGGAPPVVEPPDNFFDIQASTCKNCHAPQGYDGLNSIENPHAWETLDCTECHGGDGRATNQTFAHVCPPPAIGNRQQQVLDTRAFFLSFTMGPGVQLLPEYPCTQQDGTVKQTSPLEWLAFQNPGDLKANRAGHGCAQCHLDIVDNVSRSVMGNATGLNGGTRHGAGIPNQFADRRGKTADLDWNSLADFGPNAVVNPNYDATNRVVGEVASLYQAKVATGEAFRFDQTFTADAVNTSLNLNNLNADNYPNGMNNAIGEQLFQEVLNQACTGCYL